MNPREGLYLGTDVDGCWWKRFNRGGFLARGNGRLWTDHQGIQFHRPLTNSTLCIAWPAVERIDTTCFHSGRWAWGLPILRVWWIDQGMRLSSGFVLSAGRVATFDVRDRLHLELREHSSQLR